MFFVVFKALFLCLIGLLVYWGLTPQQPPGSYQGGEMMTMKSVIWWRKSEYPEETTDLRQVTDETFHTFVFDVIFEFWGISFLLGVQAKNYSRHDLFFSCIAVYASCGFLIFKIS